MQVEGQTHRSMKRCRELRNGHLPPTCPSMVKRFLTKLQKQFNGERTVVSTSGSGGTEYPHVIKIKLDLNLTSYIKVSSKRFIDLKIKLHNF